MAPKRKQTTTTTTTPRKARKRAAKSDATTTASSLLSSQPGPLYFWRPATAGTGFLSQWFSQHPFRDRSDPPNGYVYPTAEHYMMHQKALLFKDTEIAARILAPGTTTPRVVRTLGRRVRGFDDAVWRRARAGIVREASWCKFSLPVLPESGKPEKAEEGEENAADGSDRVWKLSDAATAQEIRAPSFRAVLLATGDRELVEASPYDRTWGIGFSAKNAEQSREKWGLNLLGKCLMEVREEFRKEDEEAKEAKEAKEKKEEESKKEEDEEVKEEKEEEPLQENGEEAKEQEEEVSEEKKEEEVKEEKSEEVKEEEVEEGKEEKGDEAKEEQEEEVREETKKDEVQEEKGEDTVSDEKTGE
ncbi:hypothetical protein F5X99DRAFT_406720 [Biscogniauxia marginata]|nr:hypothetical protein F5X99DRAFT_406720 [Biscogniauxia marginata]